MVGKTHGDLVGVWRSVRERMRPDARKRGAQPPGRLGLHFGIRCLPADLLLNLEYSPPMLNYAARRNRLRRSLRKHDVDAILVTHEPNVTYLSGFTGDSTSLLVSRRNDVLISDSRFTTQIGEQCEGLQADIRTQAVTWLKQLTRILGRLGTAMVGFEADHLTVARHAALDKHLTKTSLISTTGIVEALRAIKDKEEVKAIRHAIVVAEKTMRVISAGLTREQTENQVVAEIEYRIRQFGGVGCAFSPIVGVGPRAAPPHAPPTDTQIGESDCVLIDWGVRVGQYVSDLTRVFVTGRISPKLQRVYGVVLNAQAQAIDAIRPGALLADVDNIARTAIAKAGYGKHFGHGLGHGIGLEVHEDPRFSATQPGVLSAGMVVTVEPGIYLPGWGGVRIEDDVLVTRDGHEVLSSIPKELESCCVAV